MSLEQPKIPFARAGNINQHQEIDKRQNVAFGFVPTDLAADGLQIEIEILGERKPAIAYSRPLFDADRKRMLG